MLKTENKNVGNKYMIKDNMEFIECVDLERAKYVKSLSLEDFTNMCWDDGANEDGKKEDIKTHYAQMQQYLRDVIKEGGTIKRKYKYGNGCSEGRIYVTQGLGLQSQKKEVRGFLADGLYKDIDIKNAHPVLLLKICKDKCISSDYLEQYVKNREQILSQEGVSKLQILISMYSDKKQQSDNSWFKDFDKEMKEIQKKIMLKFPPKKESKSKNPRGSNMSMVMQKFENEIIQTIIKDISIENVGVPYYDGLFISDKWIGGNVKAILIHLQTLVKNKTGFDIELVVKEHEYSLEIPEDFVAPLPMDYETRKEEFEINNFMIRNPVRFLNKTSTFGWTIMSEKDFSTLHRSYKYEKIDSGKVMKVKFANEWFEDDEKRIYDGIDFIPIDNHDNPLIFNSYEGFDSRYIPVEERVDNAWEDFVYHINLVAGDEVDCREYILDYVAHLFQKTHVNPQVAFVIRGEQGTGKDTFMDLIEDIMGRSHNYGHRTSEVQDILGGFNECLKNKLMVQFNEVEGKDSFANKEKIKDRITAADNIIHEKYAGKYKQSNFVRYFYISNNLTPVEIPYDDRRFVVTKMSSKHRKDKEYFGPLHKKRKNRKWLDSIYSALMDRDIEFYNPSQDRPQTKAYDDMKKDNVNPIYKFLKEVLEEQDDFDFDSHEKYPDHIYTTPSNFNWEFKRWLKKNEMQNKADDYKAHIYKKIMRDTEGICVDKMVQTTKGYAERVYWINTVELWNYMKPRYFSDDADQEDILDLSPSNSGIDLTNV
tara:strand:+ start:923 stop:3208 length:2286 start_codon:yes stop_codon:yes gene_type:complete